MSACSWLPIASCATSVAPTSSLTKRYDGFRYLSLLLLWCFVLLVWLPTSQLACTMLKQPPNSLKLLMLACWGETRQRNQVQPMRALSVTFLVHVQIRHVIRSGVRDLQHSQLYSFVSKLVRSNHSHRHRRRFFSDNSHERHHPPPSVRTFPSPNCFL